MLFVRVRKLVVACRRKPARYRGGQRPVSPVFTNSRANVYACGACCMPRSTLPLCPLPSTI